MSIIITICTKGRGERKIFLIGNVELCRLGVLRAFVSIWDGGIGI
jgi:hypothetical protein